MRYIVFIEFSLHFEHSSLVLSALLLAVVIQESVNIVKAEMKNGKLVALVEQLQRFLEFIKLTVCLQPSSSFEVFILTNCFSTNHEKFNRYF